MAPWEVSSLVRNVLGMLGNVTAFGLWCAPVPTFIRVVKEKEVGDFSILPYVATWVNCVIWLYYALPMVSDDNVTLATISGMGLAFSTVFVLIYLIYCKPSKRTKVWVLIACSVAFGAVLVTSTFVSAEKSERSKIVGAFGVVSAIGLYIAPTMIVVSS
ncbi:hypothetical protein CBR_g38973 [Chara braunii]|uniref:Bidirectional sugar transporter SWEET n=1 Tax=Chara braunii TaxID=69332 RepID=A0A388K0S0_CHABU|nr:hypothetical protein CBR_g38973 [Chara braunii]|eukprot:GBG63661.1 hypothetical protein CBR_g38973 [Chara braunii]